MMDRHRKANAFRDANVPGDSRLLDAIARRTPNIAGGAKTHVFGSTILIPPKKSKARGTTSRLGPLAVTTTRPAFLAAPATGPADGVTRVWVTYGTINSKIATNYDDHFDVSGERSFYAKATFTTTGAFALTSWEIVNEPASFEIPDEDGPRPAHSYYLLGGTFKVGDGLALANNGAGSLNVWPQISNSVSGTTADTSLVWNR